MNRRQRSFQSVIRDCDMQFSDSNTNTHKLPLHYIRMKAAAMDIQIIDLFRLLSPQDIAVRSHTDAVRLPASLAASRLETAQSGG